jgi:hypothetical protein
MVVAAGALEGQPEPGHAERADAVGDILDPVLFADDAAFGVDDVIAAEAGDALVEGGFFEQIAGELLGEEAVVGQVVVEGLHHPVAPAPHGAFRVVVKAVRVGVARDVEPVDGHAFAKAGRGQEAPDGCLIGPFARAGNGGGEVPEFGGGGRQPGEIERDAAEPGLRGGRRVGPPAFGGEALAHEGVDGVDRAGRGVGRRGGTKAQCWAYWPPCRTQRCRRQPGRVRGSAWRRGAACGARGWWP